MSEWISVQDRLPEFGVPVLAIEKISSSYSMWIFERHDDDDLGVFWARNESMDDSYADEYEITHWMPLPSPPKPTNLIDNFIASGGFDRAMGGKNGE